ncbi:MAG: hypothetical protein ACYDEV_10255 [Acidiferrobacter sp.]
MAIVDSLHALTAAAGGRTDTAACHVGERRRTQEQGMSIIKDKMTEVIQSQPDDASFDEILRELAFEKMIDHGLSDSRNGRVVPNEEMERRIRTWQK